jgi:hypothetical protein
MRGIGMTKPVTNAAEITFAGKNVFVRTVTNYFTGRLVGHTPDGLLVLEDAAWVVDTGRFGNALATGELDEVEPYPDGPVVVGAVVDVSEWRHALPREAR